MERHSFLFSVLLTHFVLLRPQKSVNSLVLLAFLFVFPDAFLFPSINSFFSSFPHIKCPKYCSSLSCIVLRSVCFAVAISKTSILLFLTRCDILNMRQKIHISKALNLSSICLFSVHDSKAYKRYIAPYQTFSYL